MLSVKTTRPSRVML
jgi:hypothetical protein